MRRRIYVDPEGDLGDHTFHAYLFEEEHDFPPDGQPFSICDTGALHDEELWNEYLNACQVVNVLRTRIVSKLTPEPYDDVERAARAAYKETHASELWDEIAIERIRAELRENAQKKYKP